MDTLLSLEDPSLQEVLGKLLSFLFPYITLCTKVQVTLVMSVSSLSTSRSSPSSSLDSHVLIPAVAAAAALTLLFQVQVIRLFQEVRSQMLVYLRVSSLSSLFLSLSLSHSRSEFPVSSCSHSFSFHCLPRPSSHQG